MATLMVGVTPARERDARRRLFDALEEIYPVCFEGRDPGAWAGLDAVLSIGLGDSVAVPDQLPCLIAFGEEQPQPRAAELLLASDQALARALRGARLREAHCAGLPAGAVSGGDRVLASIAGLPAWVAGSDDRAAQRLVCAAPAELHPAEALRARLFSVRCLALLALVQFLLDLTASVRWQPPQLRAAFLIDDPNVHWLSYGHVRYDELLHDASASGYHVAMAMPPIDGWFAHPRAVALFRAGRKHLSLCVHGNDHNGPELARPRSLAEGIPVAARALARVAAFRRRTGLSVDPVMVPPHEALSEPAARALLACGFEAFCSTRVFPWAQTSPDIDWLTRPPGTGPLVGWHGWQAVAGGLPTLPRVEFRYPREELVMRSLLGQPLILYGHHDLLRDGPGVLADAAAEINRLGDVRWSSLGEIARAGFETRRAQERLELRLLGRCVRLELPAGVSELSVDVRALGPSPAARLRITAAVPREGRPDNRVDGPSPSLIVVRPDGLASLRVTGGGPCELELEDGAKQTVRMRVHPRVFPAARRVAVECRDRSRAIAAPSSR